VTRPIPAAPAVTSDAPDIAVALGIGVAPGTGVAGVGTGAAGAAVPGSAAGRGIG
jgi:hypothetical protein